MVNDTEQEWRCEACDEDLDNLGLCGNADHNAQRVLDVAKRIAKNPDEVRRIAQSPDNPLAAF